MTQLEAVRDRFLQAHANAFSSNRIEDVRRTLNELVDELEYAAGSKEVDVHEVGDARLKLARAGLELQQRTIPALQELLEAALKTAGTAAIENVVAGIFVDGTRRPSGYTVPAQFMNAGIAEKVKKTFERSAT